MDHAAGSVGHFKLLLSRPLDVRGREYRYAFAQSLIFGVPVIFLQIFGHRLGGPEAARWVAVLQALLCGWIMYVAAAGMLVEGLIRLHRRMPDLDLLAATAAIMLYLLSLITAVFLLLTRQSLVPTMFHLSVLIIALWTGFRWWRCLYLIRQSSPSGE